MYQNLTMRLGLLFIFFMFVTTAVWSQNFVFEKITTREGLSQNDVTDIFQDRNGFLLIGTNDGLNRYDGYTFKTYRVNPNSDIGINSNLVFDISEDEEGNMWIATSDEGVCKFDVKKEEFTVFRNTKENPHLLQTNQVIEVYPAKNGNIWVANSLGIDLLKPVGDSYEVERMIIPGVSNEEGYTITDIKEDVYGRIWLGTRFGVYVTQS